MRKEIILSICLMLSSYILKAQNLPSSVNSKLSKPSISNSIFALPAKPEIPYLEELKQIRSLKESYDSLRKEIKDLKELAEDSTRRDSLFTLAKERSKEVLEMESKTLESLIQSEDIPGAEVKKAAKNILELVKQSQGKLAEIKDFEGLEELLNQNEENLKALTNEWIMPKVEQVMTGTLAENWDPTQAKIPDFYGKGALEQLVQEGVPADLSFDQAKSIAKEKALHLSDSYVQFGFFALLWWGLREFFCSLQHNFNTELKLIKAQANLDQIKLSPHLLFNSLNNIAGRSSLFSNELFNQVSAFSALLQEAYKKQDVPHFLPDEIAILNHILDLIGYQTERSCIHLHIEHEQDKPLECFKIPRFILGTLMENIIKYGIIDSQEHPAEMNIAIKTDENGDTLLICSTYNLIHPVKKWLSTGHGLVAIKNIIKDAFGPDFIFDWVQNQNEFKTLMMLNYGCIKNSTD